MSIVCNIANDIRQDCKESVAGGSKNKIILLPLKYVQSYDLNTSNHLEVKDIVRFSDGDSPAEKWIGKAVIIEGEQSKLLKPKKEMIRDEFGVKYNHELAFNVVGINATKEKELEMLDKDRVVVIIEQNYHGIESSNPKARFKMYGKDVGLIVTQRLDEDNKNIDAIILKSEEGALEPNPPCFFFDTDLATTITNRDALLTVNK